MKAIVAVDLKWGIGNKGSLLQKIPEDMRFFREKTKGKVVVMGRETFESLPGKSPLKDRVNIVLSRSKVYINADVLICDSVGKALETLQRYNGEEVFVIGGSDIYNQFLPYCDEVYVTKIKKEYTADKFFSNLDCDDNWELVYESEESTYEGVLYNFNRYKNNSLKKVLLKEDYKKKKTKEIFINNVSRALEDNTSAVFVGSGISAPSTKINWFDLLEPLTNELEISLDNKYDDLPLIAQYIVNNCSGNRGPLINKILKTFNRRFELNNYHRYLATTKVSTIWTTNYDKLIEEAFSDFNVSVKANDDSLARNILDYDMEIIKMHGCVEKSHYDEIVITQEDYDDFLINKPGISQRLCEDLINKSFLFIGYSYRDPNIRNIMLSARRLSKKHTQEHYLIIKEVEVGKDGATIEDLNRQKLWCKDLKRVGISTLFIQKHEELEEILKEISKKSRGKTVYVTGSHECSEHDARDLGTFLAKDDSIVLLSGQSAGVGANVIAAFTEECIKNKTDIINRIRIFPNPYAADKKYSNDPILIPDLKKCRTKLLNSAQVIVVFSGGIGTEAEIEVAIKQNCYIVPAILRVEEREKQVFKKILSYKENIKNIELKDSDFYKKIIKEDGIVTVEEVNKCILNLMK